MDQLLEQFSELDMEQSHSDSDMESGDDWEQLLAQASHLCYFPPGTVKVILAHRYYNPDHHLDLIGFLFRTEQQLCLAPEIDQQLIEEDRWGGVGAGEVQLLLDDLHPLCPEATLAAPIDSPVIVRLFLGKGNRFYLFLWEEHQYDLHVLGQIDSLFAVRDAVFDYQVHYYPGDAYFAQISIFISLQTSHGPLFRLASVGGGLKREVDGFSS